MKQKARTLLKKLYERYFEMSVDTDYESKKAKLYLQGYKDGLDEAKELIKEIFELNEV